MSSSPPPLLRICHQFSSGNPPKTYFCFSDEVCCKDGCCASYNFKYFQTWYFWYYLLRYFLLGILVSFLVYRYICYKCSKKDQERNLIDRDDPLYNESNTAMNAPYINHLIVSYTSLDNLPPLPFLRKSESLEVLEPPPVYSVAVNLPKPTDEEQTPTYEEAVATVSHANVNNQNSSQIGQV